MTRSFDPAFTTAAVIFVWLRTTTPLKLRDDFHELLFAQSGLGRDLQRAIAGEFFDAARRNGIRDQNL